MIISSVPSTCPFNLWLSDRGLLCLDSVSAKGCGVSWSFVCLSTKVEFVLVLTENGAVQAVPPFPPERLFRPLSPVPHLPKTGKGVLRKMLQVASSNERRMLPAIIGNQSPDRRGVYDRRSNVRGFGPLVGCRESPKKEMRTWECSGREYMSVS